jgi:heterodisulfide reductase subunit B2
MPYGYFPGCSLKGQGAAYDESMLALFKVLGLPLAELRDWNCCGATSYMSMEESSAFVLSARNLAMAHEEGRQDLVAPCAACYLVLRKTQDYMERYPEIRKQVAASLPNGDASVLAGVRVRHPMEVLYTDVGTDQIRAKKVRKWLGGKVACYYGCQLVRPFGEADRDHNPMRMDELLQAAGVPTVDYSLKTKCCGGTLTGTIHEVGARLNELLIREAARKGAEAIVTICPLCQYNLDAYQKEFNGKGQPALDMPILYFTQVLGWALGADVKDLAIRRSIAGSKVLAKWFPKNAVEEQVHA